MSTPFTSSTTTSTSSPVSFARQMMSIALGPPRRGGTVIGGGISGGVRGIGLTPARTVAECPGLNRVNSVTWWVPQGSTAADTTYCDYCVRNRNITGCTRYNTSDRCNCDSYQLNKNTQKELFNISIWNHTHRKNYQAQPLDEFDSVVDIPTDTRFSIFIDAKLPPEQYYTVTAKVGKEPHPEVQINDGAKLYFKSQLLIKDYETYSVENSGCSKNFWFMQRTDESDEDWNLVEGKIADEIELKFDIYETLCRNI